MVTNSHIRPNLDKGIALKLIDSCKATLLFQFPNKFEEIPKGLTLFLILYADEKEHIITVDRENFESYKSLFEAAIKKDLLLAAHGVVSSVFPTPSLTNKDNYVIDDEEDPSDYDPESEDDDHDDDDDYDDDDDDD